MQPKQIKCELIGLRKRGNNKLGTIITLKELDSNTQHEIIVDESLGRVKQRLIEQYNGNERNGIYLTRGMTNIDINTKGDIWDINQEDWIWYTFSKEDVLRNIINSKTSIPIDYERIKEIAEELKPEVDELYDNAKK